MTELNTTLPRFFDASPVPLDWDLESFRWHPLLRQEARTFYRLERMHPYPRLLSDYGNAGIVRALIFAIIEKRDWQIPILHYRLPLAVQEPIAAVAREHIELNRRSTLLEHGTERRELWMRASQIINDAPELLTDFWLDWRVRHSDVMDAFWAHHGSNSEYFWLPATPRAIYGEIIPVGTYNREIEAAYEDALTEINPAAPWRCMFIENPDWQLQPSLAVQP